MKKLRRRYRHWRPAAENWGRALATLVDRRHGWLRRTETPSPAPVLTRVAPRRRNKSTVVALLLLPPAAGGGVVSFFSSAASASRRSRRPG